MPYFRRNRNRTNRRYKRLTKASILSNRSARSQSRQIARLNSKVNYIRKSLRPETLVGYNMYDHTFTNSSMSLNWDFSSIQPWGGFTHTDNAASSGHTIQGNHCTAKGLSIRMVVQYSDNWKDTLADSEHDQSAGYRVLILQRKAPLAPTGDSQSLTINNFIQSIPNSTSSSDDNLVAPLTYGITQYWKVLLAKTYTISRQNPTRFHNFKFNEKQLLDFTREVSNGSSDIVGKGIIYIILITGGLHHDVDYDARIKITWCSSLAFNDS